MGKLINMRILVTGSAGKLGKVVVHELRDSGHSVVGVDLLYSDTTDAILDVQNFHAVLAYTIGFDAVIHTAALHGRHMDLDYPRQSFIDTNITGTLNLLNACVANQIRRFLFTSTTSIYGNAMVDEHQAVWVTEKLVAQPRDIYDITKQTCEELCRDFFEKEGIMTSVYRVARFLPEPDNLTLNHRLYRGLDERDGAIGLRLGVEYNFTSFEIFNLSSGSPFKVEDLTEIKVDPLPVVKRYMPEAAEIYKKYNWIFPSSIDRVYRCDKASEMLGYNPKYTFKYLLNNFVK